jgi:predicted lipoprotein with Yx(FWY)xxD motif
MLQHRTTAIAGIGVAGIVAVGAIVAGMSQSGGYGKAGGSSVTSTGVRTVTSTVDGHPETILTNAAGLPLYYFMSDTPTKSNVSGSLAGLWPAVTSTSTPTATGLMGTLTDVRDAHGNQVAYNGHLLYTFVSDHRGVVTGQGVAGFVVATPGLAAARGSSQPAAGSGSAPYNAY